MILSNFQGVLNHCVMTIIERQKLSLPSFKVVILGAMRCGRRGRKSQEQPRCGKGGVVKLITCVSNIQSRFKLFRKSYLDVENELHLWSLRVPHRISFSFRQQPPLFRDELRYVFAPWNEPHKNEFRICRVAKVGRLSRCSCAGAICSRN